MNIKDYLTDKAFNDIFKKFGIEYKDTIVNKASISWDKNFSQEEPLLIIEYEHKLKNKKIKDGFCVKLFSELKW